MVVAVPPSPKFQEELIGAGLEVLVKLIISLVHLPGDDEKDVVNPPMRIPLLLAVSTQPAVLLVTNVAINVPALV